jgi:hypothetical protein
MPCTVRVAPSWTLPSVHALDLRAGERAAPPIDDNEAAIDELAFVLATDHWSVLEKIWLLEQWRYDTLLLEVAGGEGFVTEPDDAALLQQICNALLHLGPYPSPH